MKEAWVCMYIKRWLKTPFITKDGQLLERKSETPQGRVISPVLANMFLHYVFDMWMKRNFPQAPFERYADDGMIHCRTKEEELSKFDFLARENAKRYNIHINDMKGGGQHERR